MRKVVFAVLIVVLLSLLLGCSKPEKPEYKPLGEYTNTELQELVDYYMTHKGLTGANEAATYALTSVYQNQILINLLLGEANER